jgi:hypothetical protein
MADTITLSQLETILVWEGQIDNPRIREVLGVKPVWASRLMGELIQRLGSRAWRETPHAPLRMAGDEALYGHVPTPDEYLLVLQQNGGQPDYIEDARIDLANVSPKNFAVIIQAVKRNLAVSILYRSMNHPGGTERVVFPHALVRVARRWHMRAYCKQRKRFLDFALGRIVHAYPSSAPLEPGMDRESDSEWMQRATIMIVPHPALTSSQQDMIRDEHFPGRDGLEIEVRPCLLDYMLRDNRIARDPEAELPPEFLLALAPRKA